MGLSPLRFVYNRYATGSKSWFHWLHRKIVRSEASVKWLFGMRMIRPEKLDSYYDLTTLLMKWVIRKRLKKRPDLRLLEIGAGTFAVLSGCLSRYATTAIDAAEIDPRRAESSRRHVQLNGVKVNVFDSDVFSNAPASKYDIVFWNLPYYNDPALLERLFAGAPDFITEQGELIIGYNSKPLPRETVLGILSKYPRLYLAKIENWRWNLHDVLIIRRSGDETRAALQQNRPAAATA